MDRFLVEITVNGKYVEVDCDGRMPFMLADQIKDIVNKFYNENTARIS